MVKDSDLLNEFVFEAKAHIAEIEAGLLRLEEGEDDDDTINGVFRAAHSIKGTAGFFELHKIVELAHSIESLFGELREHHLKVNSEMADAILVAVDLLKELINLPVESEKYDITPHVAAIRNFLVNTKNQLGLSEQSAGMLAAWDVWDQLTSDEGESGKVLVATPEETDNDPPVQQREIARSDSKAHAAIMEDSVRVNVGLLNDLLNLAGEMVLQRNQLLRIAQEVGRQVPQLDVIAHGIDELTTNVQKKVMKTRMQPIANVFNKFPRIVRDLSRKVGKEVDLVMQGMDVELDRSLIEALVDPMTHLVRNALDHGFEPAGIREASNKPLTGSLVLRAYHESGRVIVDVCDDGAGIDLERVKRKAVQNGIASEKEIAVMRETEIINLIMTPGFSTAERLTEISGRGVGMDVVKTNIEKLGGKIEIFSDIGIGTTFRMILPLTLAIISSLIVVADKQFFAIPQANVRELVLIQPDVASEKRVEMVHGNLVLRLRDRVLPLVRLSDVLAAANATNEHKAGFACLVDNQQILRILVVKAVNMAYGLIVDSVYDTEEILVKPLSEVLGNCGLYSGVTVLGDGCIAMILDTESLRVRSGLCPADDAFSQPDSGEVAFVDENQYVLLFKCSGGEMLGLDLAMVSRIEEVAVSRLQKIGSKYYVSVQGQTIRVIKPEHYLPISRRKNTPTKVYVILPKLVKHSIGIIAEQICDAIYTKVVMDKDGVCGKGILGSALIQDTVVTLLNMHELFAESAPEYYTRPFHSKKVGGEQDFRTVIEEKRITILLVEDTPFFLRVVKSYLESDGYEVITAENGREALERLIRTKIDIVVTDIEMPLMTGIELVRAIRASKELQHLPVIALTSLSGEANKEKGMRAGFDVYEYKLDRTRLLDSLRDVWRNQAQAVQEV